MCRVRLRCAALRRAALCTRSARPAGARRPPRAAAPCRTPAAEENKGTPVLMAHGDSDQVVAYDFGKRRWVGWGAVLAGARCDEECRASLGCLHARMHACMRSLSDQRPPNLPPALRAATRRCRRRASLWTLRPTGTWVSAWRGFEGDGLCDSARRSPCAASLPLPAPLPRCTSRPQPLPHARRPPPQATRRAARSSWR